MDPPCQPASLSLSVVGLVLLTSHSILCFFFFFHTPCTIYAQHPENCTDIVFSAPPKALAAIGLIDTPNGDSSSAITAHLAALVGILLAHGCHLASSLVLYQLGTHIWADAPWALVSALLHVLSPAGLFLSAPYAESPHALLCFVGWLLLVKSCGAGSRLPQPLARGDALTLLAGVSFGLATWFRTNGLLNGAPFALEVLVTLYRLVEDLGPGSFAAYVRKLAVLGLSGLFVAAGSLVPQFFAYRIYCAGPAARPWCSSFVPSIYGFVQREYW